MNWRIVEDNFWKLAALVALGVAVSNIAHCQTLAPQETGTTYPIGTLAPVSIAPPGTNPAVLKNCVVILTNPPSLECETTPMVQGPASNDQITTPKPSTASTSQAGTTFDQNAVFTYASYYDKPGAKFSGGIGYASLVQKSGVYVYFGVDNSRTSRVGTVIYLRSFGPINAYALLAGTVNQTATATLGGLSTAGLFEWRLKGSWSPFAAYQWDSHVQGSSAYGGVIKHWGSK